MAERAGGEKQIFRDVENLRPTIQSHLRTTLPNARSGNRQYLALSDHVCLETWKLAEEKARREYFEVAYKGIDNLIVDGKVMNWHDAIMMVGYARMQVHHDSSHTTQAAVFKSAYRQVSDYYIECLTKLGLPVKDYVSQEQIDKATALIKIFDEMVTQFEKPKRRV